MSYWWFLPILLGLQFLLFDHKHLKFFRNLMSKTWLTNFLSNCAFCRCAWLGAGIAIVVYDERSILHIFCIGVSSGILGLAFNLLFYPCLRVYERHHL